MSQSCGRKMRSILKKNTDNNSHRPTYKPILEEEDKRIGGECRDAGEESRYDPKERRDAVKILAPFVWLIEDINNPYA